MSAFEKAWSLLKNEDGGFGRMGLAGGEPRGLTESQMRAEEESEEESYRMRGRDASLVVPEATKLFLGSIDSYLEGDVDEYVVEALENQGFYDVPEELIEQARQIAIDRVNTLY